jgi:hypothetical protein
MYYTLMRFDKICLVILLAIVVLSCINFIICKSYEHQAAILLPYLHFICLLQNKLLPTKSNNKSTSDQIHMVYIDIYIVHSNEISLQSVKF